MTQHNVRVLGHRGQLLATVHSGQPGIACSPLRKATNRGTELVATDDPMTCKACISLTQEAVPGAQPMLARAQPVEVPLFDVPASSNEVAPSLAVDLHAIGLQLIEMSYKIRYGGYR